MTEHQRKIVTDSNQQSDLTGNPHNHLVETTYPLKGISTSTTYSKVDKADSTKVFASPTLRQSLSLNKNMLLQFAICYLSVWDQEGLTKRRNEVRRGEEKERR